jgi:hypothetical protein
MRNPEIDSLLRRLGRLRARVRRLTALSGVAHVVTASAVALLAWFLSDWLLDLPLGVRRFVRLGLLDRPEGLGLPAWAGLLLLALAVLVLAARRRSALAAVAAFAVAGVPGLIAWVAARRLVGPLRVPLSDDALALTVEGRFARLEDRVAAALDFDRELAAPSRGESPAMMARVVEEAAREAQGVEFASVASGRRAWRDAGVAALAAGALAATLLAMPGTAALWPAGRSGRRPWRGRRRRPSWRSSWTRRASRPRRTPARPTSRRSGSRSRSSPGRAGRSRRPSRSSTA